MPVATLQSSKIRVQSPRAMTVTDFAVSSGSRRTQWRQRLLFAPLAALIVVACVFSIVWVIYSYDAAPENGASWSDWLSGKTARRARERVEAFERLVVEHMEASTTALEAARKGLESAAASSQKLTQQIGQLQKKFDGLERQLPSNVSRAMTQLTNNHTACSLRDWPPAMEILRKVQLPDGSGERWPTTAEMEAAMVFNPCLLEIIEQRRAPWRAQPPVDATYPPIPPPRCEDNQYFEQRPEPFKGRIVHLLVVSLEVDLLELIMAELYDLVDVFVVVEATWTYAHTLKPLFYARNLERYMRWRDKIHYILMEKDMRRPSDGARGFTDFQVEEALHDAILQRVITELPLQDEDLLLVADLDEFPKREGVAFLRACRPIDGGPIAMLGHMYRYNFFWDTEMGLDKPHVYTGAYAKQVLGTDPQSLHTLFTVKPSNDIPGSSRHLTSALEAEVMSVKVAWSSHWDRNWQLSWLLDGKMRELMHYGSWFENSMAGYDAEQDPRNDIPLYAKVNKEYFRFFWGVDRLGTCMRPQELACPAWGAQEKPRESQGAWAEGRAAAQRNCPQDLNPGMFQAEQERQRRVMEQARRAGRRRREGPVPDPVDEAVAPEE